MNGQFGAEQSQNFNDRLSQWISSQGFWFQLRYSLSSGGSKGTLTYHLFRLFMRIAIFAVIAAIGVLIFVFRYTGTQGYRQDLNSSLKEKFAAEEIEMRGFSHKKGEFYIGRMAMIGGDGTFFSGFELRNLKCRMGMFDPFLESWDPGMVEIDTADVEIRAGADTKDSSGAIAEVLFQDPGRVDFDKFKVKDMTVRWGFSERTRGSIKGSTVQANRDGGSWRFSFRGGIFTQNWLRELEIVELDVLAGKRGLVFENAVFRKGAGSVTLRNGRVEAGERPEVKGDLRLRGMDVAELMPASVRGFVDGTFSGEFKVFGSTNSTEGLGFKGDVILEGGDTLTLRDRVPLLEALSVVDAFNNYRRVDFGRGSFSMKSYDGKLTVRDIDLTAGDLVTLEGGFTARVPKVDEALVLSEKDSTGRTVFGEEGRGGEFAISLRRAAEASREQGGEEGEEDSLFAKLGLNLEDRLRERLEAERLTRSYRYEGNFTVTLRKDAFARAPDLANEYPGTGRDGRVALEVPVEGVLFDLTADQADDLLKKGSR